MQKLALARVLINDYKLLVFDEPSSTLDAYSEKEFFDIIFKKYSDVSIILISHKLANIINVDRIYFLEGGRIVEEGTHDELIFLGGKYKELYDIQAEKYIV